MFKLFKNVVNLDDVVEQYGVDIFCVYEMFMGLFDVLIVWFEEGFEGLCKFLDCVYCLIMIKEIIKENSGVFDKVYNEIVKVVIE